jgi:signal transduction histidine kinase
VNVSVADGLPPVRVDKMRIVEVLVNLIENSVKYMGVQPDPSIEIGYRSDEGQTIFFVRDNGIGIDPSQHDKVFELFYKVDNKTEGTGAGLAIVKRIIEVHGGKIWIESGLGKGCTVCFTLPLARG